MPRKSGNYLTVNSDDPTYALGYGTRTDDEAFAFRVLMNFEEDENGCWLWQGHRDIKGYGTICWEGHASYVKIHRLMYQVHYGLIPKHLEIDHLCNNPPCANIDHLEAVTPEENIRRKVQRKTKCINGHAYIPPNIGLNSDGDRICLICRRKTALDYYYRKKAKRAKALNGE